MILSEYELFYNIQNLLKPNPTPNDQVVSRMINIFFKTYLH